MSGQTWVANSSLSLRGAPSFTTLFATDRLRALQQQPTSCFFKTRFNVVLTSMRVFSKLSFIQVGHSGFGTRIL